MPSPLTHALVGAALAQAATPTWRKDWRFWCAAVLSPTLPDIDVIGFHLGVRYADVWGHRGMTHSLLFAAITAIVLCALVAGSWADRWKQALLLFLIVASHGMLDALTNGGLGVAFFSPFDLRRYFFPWRPIRVSPLAAHRFLSDRGIAVLWSEIRWVWGPALFLGAFLYSLRRWQEAQGAGKQQQKLELV